MADTESSRLLTIVEREVRRLRSMAAAETGVRPAPEKWCRREILGHLLDSAFNNHQRFVRAQLADALDIAGYAQDDWVRVQGYAQADWGALVALWEGVNRHLALVMARIPAAALSRPIHIGGQPPVTLAFVVTDYIRHVEHHLAQI
jgi:hypothetical protein